MYRISFININVGFISLIGKKCVAEAHIRRAKYLKYILKFIAYLRSNLECSKNLNFGMYLKVLTDNLYNRQLNFLLIYFNDKIISNKNYDLPNDKKNSNQMNRQWTILKYPL